MMRGFQSLWIGSSPSFRFFMVLVVLLSFLATKDTVDPRQKYEVFLNTHFKNCPGYPVVDGGNNWHKISDWTGMYGSEIDYTYVHGDLHKIAFMPGSSDFFIVGTDGGVFITNSGSDSI